MLVINTQNRTMDYSSNNVIANDVCRQFEVKKIVKSIDAPDDEATLLIEVKKNHTESRFFELPTSAIVGIDSLIGKLVANGLTLDHYMKHSASMYLMDGYRLCQNDDRYEYRHNSLGWFDYEGKDVFLYDQSKVDETHISKYIKPFKFKNGDKQAYIDFLKNEMFPVPTLALALTIGYSAVVSSKLKDSCDIGTIIVNLCGASSTGKTTAEQLLVSPFACPIISNKYGLVHTFHSTANALFESIDGIHGLPIVLDDITTNKNINVENLLYTISSGEEKMRCQQDGSLKETKSGFDGVVVISSEYPVYDLASENQGLKARVIHTQGITWTPNAETAERIKAFVSNNYGFTGIDFANYVATIKDLKPRYDQAKTETHKLMKERDNLSDRLESKYAIFYLTIELLNECFDLDLNVCEMMKILLAPEQESLAERDIGKKALSVINDYIIKKMKHFKIINHNNKFQDFKDSNGDHLGTIRHEEGKIDVFIPTADINKLLKDSGINEYVSVKKKWISEGVLVGDTGRTDCKHLGRRC
ncbi:MAG: DUF927 domain-containing protein [Clostridia bacterium]|nr:DUF927 domain-containing protein [Clostridia bacterium]